MILKLQLSLESSDGVQRLLIYNEDRSYEIERDAEPGDVEFMGGAIKKFVHAVVIDNSMAFLQDEAPWQDW